MAFRQTTFDPSVSQQYANQGPGVTGLAAGPGQGPNMADMEEKLAREMARMRIDDEKRKRELNKICAESDELKELQNKIKAAYLNKERSQQMTEHQYRQQIEIEEDAAIDMQMLRDKEIGDIRNREEMQKKLEERQQNKRNIQKQIDDNNKLREEAY